MRPGVLLHGYTKRMKKALNIFFVVLGVIFLILILAGLLFYTVPSFGSSPAGTTITRVVTGGESSGGKENIDQNPMLNAEQEAALQSFGIDPANLPKEITPEQEACFVSKLGQQRVDEIKGGAAPTASDFFKARGCI